MDMIQFMPKSFENGSLSRQPINQGLVQSVRLVGEYRGKQALFKQQSPQVLEALRENALIQSTESSTRIEGPSHAFGDERRERRDIHVDARPIQS